MEKEEVEQAMGRRLRGLHPLYGTLSGDVLWELFLELGFAEEECGNLLDGCVAEMQQVISVMRQLETDKAAGYVYTAKNPESLCAHCAGLVNTKVVTQSFEALPPFAVGCGLGCRVLDEGETSLAEADVSGVRYRLYCEKFGRNAFD